MLTAKVMKDGNSYTIRLPKEVKIDTKEVYIKKEDNYIVLIPKNNKWDIVFKELAEIKNETKDFLLVRNQDIDQNRELF